MYKVKTIVHTQSKRKNVEKNLDTPEKNSNVLFDEKCPDK